MKRHIFKALPACVCHGGLCHAQEGDTGCYANASDPIHTVPAEEPKPARFNEQAAMDRLADIRSALEPEARTAADDVKAEVERFREELLRRLKALNYVEVDYVDASDEATDLYAERIQALVARETVKDPSGKEVSVLDLLVKIHEQEAEITKLRAENETLRRERDEARAGWRMLWTCCMSPTWGSHKADCPKEPRS